MPFRLLARKVVGFASLLTGTTNITTAAYVQLVASLPGTIEAIQFYNGSTSTLALASGASGSETNEVLLGPGLSDIIPVETLFPKGSRMSVIAVDTTASAGTLAINFLSG